VYGARLDRAIALVERILNRQERVDVLEHFPAP
jgi:hypothetical protein